MQTTSRSIYFDNYFDAFEECQKRKALQACNMTSRVERSPYGGYRVRTILVDLMFIAPKIFAKKHKLYDLTK